MQKKPQALSESGLVALILNFKSELWRQGLAVRKFGLIQLLKLMAVL